MRERTSYSQHIVSKKDGVRDETQSAPSILRDLLNSNWTKFWLFTAITVFVILLIISQDLVQASNNTGIVCSVFSLLILASSAYAGNTQAVPDALVVDGIGSISDMKVAKKRANNVLGPLLGTIVGSLMYIIGLAFSIIT